MKKPSQKVNLRQFEKFQLPKEKQHKLKGGANNIVIETDLDG